MASVAEWCANKSPWCAVARADDLMMVQVRIKWWGEKGYGSLLRPAACVGLGPALTSSVFYSIRCSR